MISPLDLDFRPNLRPVRDQGHRPTCLAHSLSSAHEHLLARRDYLSPEYLHYFSTSGSPNRGSTMDAAMAALAAEGQPDEGLCPYQSGGLPDGWRPPSGLTVYRRGSSRLSTGTLEVVNALKNGRIPVLGISLPSEFFSPQDPWVIKPGKQRFGLHAVAAVGFRMEAPEPMILVRNSWGESWGDHGHALLSPEFLRTHLQEAIVIVPGES